MPNNECLLFFSLIKLSSKWNKTEIETSWLVGLFVLLAVSLFKIDSVRFSDLNSRLDRVHWLYFPLN